MAVAYRTYEAEGLNLLAQRESLRLEPKGARCAKGTEATNNAAIGDAGGSNVIVFVKYLAADPMSTSAAHDRKVVRTHIGRHEL